MYAYSFSYCVERNREEKKYLKQPETSIDRQQCTYRKKKKIDQ